MGERSLEFAVAGGLALTHVELGEVVPAEQWLDRAAELVRDSPSPWRARQLEVWRGMVRAGAGDAAGMRHHLEKAAKLAQDQGRPAHRCEILARLALECATLGAQGPEEGLLELVGPAASEVRALLSVLPGQPPWGAQAEAALAARELARGDATAAAAHARRALDELDGARREDAFLEVVLPAGAALLAGGSPDEAEKIRTRLRLLLRFVTQRIVDPDVRVRWFRAPVGQRLAQLAGPVEPVPGRPPSGPQQVGLADAENRLLQLLVEGRSNAEIAEEMKVTEDAVGRHLSELYVRIGASSRADATANAFIRRMV
jgi:DNA-binding CsgD family transcriptional regulator